MAAAPPPTYGPPDPRQLKYQRRMMRDQLRAQRDRLRFEMRAGRRGSLLSPIFMLAVGVIFLLVETGHVALSRVWEVYGRWWPLLLVLAGVVLLAEWALDRVFPGSTDHPYARRRHGGVLTLIILLALIGSAMKGLPNWHDMGTRGFSINPDNLAEFLGSKHESDETLDHHLPTGTALTIDNPHGDVTVTGASTDGQIHLTVHKQVFTGSDADAETEARELTPTFTDTPTLLSLKVPSRGGATADLTLTLPINTPITINANHGDIHADNIAAPLIITANHGDVALSSISAPVTAHINNSKSSLSAHQVKGPLTIAGHGDDLTLSDIAGNVDITGDYYGTTHLEHIAGSFHFHSSRTDLQLARLDGQIEIDSDGISVEQAAGPLTLTTRNRNLTLNRISGPVSVTNRNGTVELTGAPPLGNVTIENRSGSVTLTLPEQASFAVTAETTDGNIENDFSLPQGSHDDKRSTLSGSVGPAGPTSAFIRISTTQGDVALRKASIAPVPPAPPHPPAVAFRGENGTTVSLGKDGVKVAGSDGRAVLLDNHGLRITDHPTGSTASRNPIADHVAGEQQ